MSDNKAPERIWVSEAVARKGTEAYQIDGDIEYVQADPVSRSAGVNVRAAPVNPVPCELFGTKGNEGCRVHRYVPCPSLDAVNPIPAVPATPGVETLKQHALRLIKEMQECSGGMCTHCIDVLCNELEPLIEIAVIEVPATPADILELQVAHDEDCWKLSAWFHTEDEAEIAADRVRGYATRPAEVSTPVGGEAEVVDPLADQAPK